MILVKTNVEEMRMARAQLSYIPVAKMACATQH